MFRLRRYQDEPRFFKSPHAMPSCLQPFDFPTNNSPDRVLAENRHLPRAARSDLHQGASPSCGRLQGRRVFQRLILDSGRDKLAEPSRSSSGGGQGDCDGKTKPLKFPMNHHLSGSSWPFGGRTKIRVVATGEKYEGSRTTPNTQTDAANNH